MHNATPTLAGLAWDFLCDRSSVVMLRLDREGVILAANAHALALVGLPLAGNPLSSMLLNFEGELSPVEWLAHASQPRLMNIRTTSGIPQTLQVTIEPAGSDFILFGQVDAEEQDRLGREVLELNRELGNLSRELGQKNAKLEQLNALKNQFLGMAAHDLRKPTGLILNYAEFLIDEAGSGLCAEHRQFLQTIYQSAGRMSGVIHNFLDISVIDAGHLSLARQEADLEDLARVAQTMVAPMAGARRIRFETELASGARHLLVDGPKIEQALTNLVGNAVEHSPDEGCVRIVAERLADAVRVSVSDEGKGISPEKRERLFQAFANDNSPKPSGERSIGLGLLIAAKIIEAHGGRMFAESEPGCGATFGFILPVRVEQQTHTASTNHP